MNSKRINNNNEKNQTTTESAGVVTLRRSSREYGAGRRSGKIENTRSQYEITADGQIHRTYDDNIM